MRCDRLHHRLVQECLGVTNERWGSTSVSTGNLATFFFVAILHLENGHQEVGPTWGERGGRCTRPEDIAQADIGTVARHIIQDGLPQLAIKTQALSGLTTIFAGVRLRDKSRNAAL